MSSANFLQRFEGKTQKIGKEGIRNALGDKDPDTVIHTNTNIATQQKYKPPLSGKSVKQVKQPAPQTKNIPPNEQKKQNAKNTKYVPPQPPKKAQNPFLVSNPFYLDEEEKLQQEKQKKIKQAKQKAQKAEQAKKAAVNDPKSTKTSSYTKSIQKKTNSKQWVKLGGLGANIGGQEWLQKRKKVQKMQQFAGQVKSINNEKIKPIDPSRIKQQKKQPNSRQKMLEYGRSVPKPAVRRHYQEQQQIQEVPHQAPQNQLTELQLYAQKHQKLRNMLKKEY